MTGGVLRNTEVQSRVRNSMQGASLVFPPTAL
jgi:hypothetical protein